MRARRERGAGRTSGERRLRKEERRDGGGVLVLPVLGGVGHAGQELHSFGVVMDLCVEAQILLHKVTRGHEALAILIRNAGILKHTHKQMLFNKGRGKKKKRKTCLLFLLSMPSLHEEFISAAALVTPRLRHAASEVLRWLKHCLNAMRFSLEDHQSPNPTLLTEKNTRAPPSSPEAKPHAQSVRKR